MSETPLVTVLMPVYNAQAFIGEAVESILSQTFTNFEFIIIDDCSTDASIKIIETYASQDSRIRILKNDINLKISNTLNKGLQAAKGKYVARMDADDYSYKDRLEKQVSYMESHNETLVLGGAVDICDSSLNKLHLRRYPLNDIDIRKALFKFNPFAHPAVMFRTDKLLTSGGYNATLYDAEDYDLYFRLGSLGKFHNLEDTLIKYRMSDVSVSHIRQHRQQLVTLYIRIKAVAEYGYRMGAPDKVYFILQLISIYIIPQKLKFLLFNLLRMIIFKY